SARRRSSRLSVRVTPPARKLPPACAILGSGYTLSSSGPLCEKREAGTRRLGKAAPVPGSMGAVRVEFRKSPLRSASVGTKLSAVVPAWLYFHSSLTKKKSLFRSVFHFRGT